MMRGIIFTAQPLVPPHLERVKCLCKTFQKHSKDPSATTKTTSTTNITTTVIQETFTIQHLTCYQSHTWHLWQKPTNLKQKNRTKVCKLMKKMNRLAVVGRQSETGEFWVKTCIIWSNRACKEFYRIVVWCEAVSRLKAISVHMRSG